MDTRARIVILGMANAGRRLAFALGVAVAGGCGDATAPPPPAPAPAVYRTAHFTIVDAAALDTAVIASLQLRLETEYARVAQALPDFPAPDSLTFNILVGAGIPFVTLSERSLNQWAENLAPDYIPHQLTHLFTGYPRRAFLEEGLAVYVTEVLLPDSRTVNPYRGQPPHAWVALFDASGSLISLYTAFRASGFSYSYQGSSADASAWQVFLEAGSFTQWVIETYGWDKWLALYTVDDLGAALGASTVDLERGWLAAVHAQYPNPLSCEEALGTVGSREEFWCRRARGE